jgi:hypothetical protein
MDVSKTISEKDGLKVRMKEIKSKCYLCLLLKFIKVAGFSLVELFKTEQ